MRTGLPTATLFMAIGANRPIDFHCQECDRNSFGFTSVPAIQLLGDLRQNRVTNVHRESL